MHDALHPPILSKNLLPVRRPVRTGITKRPDQIPQIGAVAPTPNKRRCGPRFPRTVRASTVLKLKHEGAGIGADDLSDE